MKQYLKMADVFEGEVKAKHIDEEAIDQIMRGEDSGKDWTIEDSRYWMAMQYEHASYAAHAINSHDELVQMNQELLAALKQVVGDVRALADHSYGVHGLHQNGDLAPWNSLFSGGFFESWLLSVDDADAVIAKIEGGAV